MKRLKIIYQDVHIPWILLLLVLILALFTSMLEVKNVTITASIIDSAKHTINASKLIEFIIFIVSTCILNVINNYVQGWTFQRINYGVRIKLWNKLMRLPIRYFDGENGDGFVSRVTTDVSESSTFFYAIIYMITTIYATCICVENMYEYSPELTKMLIGTVPFVFLFSFLIGKLFFYTNRRYQIAFSKSTEYLAERTRNLKLVKASQTENQEIEKGKKLFDSQFKASILNTVANSTNLCAYTILLSISLIITFVFGSKLVSTGAITIGRLIGFYSLSSLLGIRYMQLIMFYAQLKGFGGRLDKVVEVLQIEEESDEGIELDYSDEDLVLKNITFAYREVDVLKEICCTIPKGKVTAIIGTNGSGKSTLFKLLERMYDPSSGELLFGEKNANTYKLSSWRKSFAIVSQDKPLLSGTVRENIIYGVNRKVSEEELMKVARQANIYDFIMDTPGGFDAQVGPEGSNFSGGQRQCIAIARAMMRNPDYLLLDEATSNLDSKSEKLVSDALDKLMEGRTTIMIAHNYSAITHADYILVMDDGKLIAQGTPSELMNTSEYYRNFCKQGI